jgi:hypothetical protein
MVGALLTVPAQAADSARAKALFNQGATSFALGKFDEAIESWEAGFKESPNPEFLYNIAQAHRLAGDPAKALFFYKSFLRHSPGAKNRADVQQKIAGLREQIEAARREGPPVVPPPQVTPIALSPPPPTSDPAPPEPAALSAGADAEAEDLGTSFESLDPIDIGAGVGLGAWLGGVGAETGASFAAQLAGGFTFGSPERPTRFRLGGRLGFGALGERVGTPKFWGLLIAPAVRHVINDRLHMTGELGLGLVVVSGLSPGSVLLRENIVGVDGSLARFEVRPAVTAAYRMNRATSLFVSPGLAFDTGRNGVFPRTSTRLEILFGASFHIDTRARP